MSSKNNSKIARATNPNRQLGLGACPDVNTLKSCLGGKFQDIPVIEYVTWTVTLPVADQNVQATFSDEINLFGNASSVPGVAAVDSSFVVNGILQTDMFVIGFGAHFFNEPQSWTQIGNSITPAAGVIPPSPDVATANDLANGALGTTFAGATPTSTISPAVVEWGAPAWRAAWQAANAYRFVWTVNQRMNVIDEMLADVSYFGPYAEASAASDSEIPIHPFVQRLNASYAALCKACNQAAGFGFYPVSHRRVGSVTTYGTTGGTVAPVGNVGIFHPTRDFDLAGTTWGGLANNSAGQCTPFRKLPRPCLIERGLPIGFSLQASNQVNLDNFQSEISASGAPLNGNGSVPEFDAPTGGAGGYTTGALWPSTGPAAGQTVMGELTLDATPVLASQQVQIGRSVYKGGQFKLAFLIKGYEVMRDWCGFLNGCDAAGNLYTTSGGVYTSSTPMMSPSGTTQGFGR
jgi:hypothetical protein